MPKFTIEEHETRMREILKPKAPEGFKPPLLESLLAKAKLKIKKPPEGELKV